MIRETNDGSLQQRQEELHTKLLLWFGVFILSSLAALAVLLVKW